MILLDKILSEIHKQKQHETVSFQTVGGDQDSDRVSIKE